MEGGMAEEVVMAVEGGMVKLQRKVFSRAAEAK